jgi:outer membrane protein assembly factor BamC
VDDRDRTQGVYFVRFLNPNDLSGNRGFWEKMFSSKTDEDMKRAKRYRVLVKETSGTVVVTVQDDKGTPEVGEPAIQLLTLLDQQLGK